MVVNDEVLIPPPPQGIRGPPGMIGADGANGDPVS